MWVIKCNWPLEMQKGLKGIVWLKIKHLKEDFLKRILGNQTACHTMFFHMEKENTLKSMESINCLVSKISTFVVSRRKNNLRVKIFFFCITIPLRLFPTKDGNDNYNCTEKQYCWKSFSNFFFQLMNDKNN